MQYFFTFLCISLCSLLANAQADYRIAEGTQALSTVAQYRMPVQNNEALLQQEMNNRRSDRPDHFAVPMQVNINPETHGTWEQTPNGTDVWRLRIYSQGAKSLNLGFTTYKMPEGGSLILYSADMKSVQGPFTPLDNEEHEQLWTPVLGGDELVIEVQLPLNNKKALELELSAVNHDFVGIEAQLSGSCNLDVVCGAEDGWDIVDDYRDIIQSVAYTTLNGFANCTGFLVNNTNQDLKPLFMTAFHCGVDVQSAPTMVAYWNFQNSDCRQPNSPQSGVDGDGQLNTFNSGSILRSTWAQSDFVLVELDDPVVDAADAFFAGWTAEPILPTSAIAVHHPSNDEKRISFENDNDFYLSTWVASPDEVTDGDHIIVEDWDIGTTEGGSSGSPLFDQNKRVVGQLHGGGAACGNDSYDVYGWFHTSWEGGGTPATRLKDWLDPNNTGALTIDGTNGALTLAAGFLELCNNEDDLGIVLNVGNFFQSGVNLSLSNVPSGLSANLSSAQTNPGSIVILNLSNINNLSSGFYNININGTDGLNSSGTTLSLQIFESNIATPTLTEPSNMETDVPSFTTFQWQADDNVNNYQFQLSTNSNFNNTIVDENTDQNTFSGIILNPVTTYYWRIRPSNVCGTGNWSSTTQFTTANTICEQPTGTDLPIEISTGPANVYTSTINITEQGIVEDINVINLRGLHTWVSDLDVTLISPSGTEVLLFTDQCGSEDDYFINFDDQVTATSIICPMNTGATYQPAGLLADFNGEQAAGTWTLRIDDTANDDGGVWQNWQLEICATAPVAVQELPQNSVSIYPNPTHDQVQINLEAIANMDVEIELYHINGQLLNRQNLAQNTTTTSINLNPYTSGVYIVKVITKQGILSKRVVKQ